MTHFSTSASLSPKKKNTWFSLGIPTLEISISILDFLPSDLPRKISIRFANGFCRRWFYWSPACQSNSVESGICVSTIIWISTFVTISGRHAIFQATYVWKINMEAKSVGLEDDSPFQFGWILGFYVNLRGCISNDHQRKKIQLFQSFPSNFCFPSTKKSSAFHPFILVFFRGGWSSPKPPWN